VADLDRHRRLHAVVVEADDGQAAHRPSGLDALLGSAGDGQVQTAFDSNHAPLARRFHRVSGVAEGASATASAAGRRGAPASINTRIIKDCYQLITPRVPEARRLRENHN